MSKWATGAIVALALWGNVPAIAAPLDDALAAMRADNWPAAIKLLIPLADAGNPEAQLRLGLIFEEGASVPVDETKAMEYYLKAAERGQHQAEFKVARGYILGKGGLTLNRETGMEYLARAAAGGIASAAYLLGQDYMSREDVSSGLKWITAAANSGYEDAALYLGEAYLGATIVEKDAAKSIAAFRLSADKGGVRAQWRLGLLYSDGKAVPEDTIEASKWWTAAADGGHPGAQFQVGQFYERGTDRPKNDRVARQWYQKAADNGDLMAMYKLSVFHAEGLGGVPEDWQLAAQWSSKAAERGLLLGQFMIAQQLRLGRGIERDKTEALKWVLLALRQDRETFGYDDLKKFSEMILREVSPQEFLEATRRAEDWLRNHSHVND